MTFNITDDWYEDFHDVLETLDPDDSIMEEDMQIDVRYVVTSNDEG